MKHFFYIFLLFLLVVTACNTKQNQSPQSTFAPKVVEAQGYLVPQDSMSQPKVVLVDEKKLKKIPVGKPTVILTNTNIHVAITTNIHKVGTPRICTPGQDTFLLPKTIPAIDSPFVAGIPEIVTAKDFFVKDQNPENFFSLSKLQGLKHDVIGCMLQDKSGNLWFGTNGGGVSKYDGKSFTHFTEKEGLSNNTVYSMLEDKKGNLWFGTNGGGVSKYDGKFFTNFTEKEGLSSNTVLSMLEDKNGNLWFGTVGGGVSQYDGQFFTHFTEKQGLSNNTVRSILEDKRGTLWFGTYGGGVSKYNEKAFTHFTEKEGLSGNTVLSILEDKSGNLWFGTYDGVCKYDGKIFTHFTEKEGLSNNTVVSILEDINGDFWFGTNGGGVSKLALSVVEGLNKYTFTHFTEKEGLSNSTVWSILEDKNGNIWLGTDGGGVSQYNGKRFTHFTEKEGLSNNIVLSILEDESKNLWFGTAERGISKYDGKSFIHFTEKEGLSNNNVRSILEDKSGNLWFGTNGGGVSKYDGKYFTHFTEKEGLPNNTIWSMLEDKNRNIWFGTYGGGVCKYDGKSFTHFTNKEGLPNNTVRSMLEDKSGNLWLGTNGGLSKYDGKSFTHFTEKEGLPNNSVVAMLEDKNGNLWFGTYGGVCKYDGKTFTHYTEKEGLSNSTVFSILEDKSGNLWFGTRFGLSMLSPENKEKLMFFSNNVNTSKEADGKVFFKNYAYEDGFLGFGVNGGQTICEDKNGTIWIGANDRLTAYHPEGEMEDTIAPNIQLTRVELFDEIIDWSGLESDQDSILTLVNGVRVCDFEFDGVSKWYGVPKNLSLAYNNNFLTFNFIGITQKQSKKVKYQYKLEGIDGNWSAITSRRLAPYANLSPGTYSFKVKAMNSLGYWSNELNYTFTIRPPWWQTLWFRSFMILTIISLVVFYIKWRERKLKAEKDILEQIVEVRTHELAEKTIVAEANEKDALKQKEIADSQREIANSQKQIIEKKHKEITDSINYAERIQRSFLATTELLDENLKDYFVFFQPKDVVSGDFYWASKLNNGNFALVTADSTGHGVPGAIMSILNISSLEKSLEGKKLCEPNEILNHTREKIIERLKKDGSPEGGKDGMDASLISFDFKNKKLTYAAANNPIWIVRENQLLEFSPDKMPVGKHDKDSVSFTQHTIDLQKNDVVYALTDGFPDQFGGPKGKKFMSKQLKELLISISNLEMQEQKEKLNTTFNNWKGDLEQVDDVCLIGVRV